MAVATRHAELQSILKRCFLLRDTFLSVFFFFKTDVSVLVGVSVYLRTNADIERVFAPGSFLRFYISFIRN